MLLLARINRQTQQINMITAKFKKGDRIRHKSSGLVGTIVSVEDHGTYNVRYPDDNEVYFVRDVDIEFVDVKTAFLTRLSELLRDFDVFLIAHKTDMPVSVYFNDSEDYKPFASIGKECDKGCGIIIEPDTI